MRVPVYDIKNCGPRHRFVANGKLVHNSDSVNMQNLPRSSPLKKATKAPPGYVVIDCDSSQIEARTLAFVAGQWDLVDTFRKNNEEMAAGVPKPEWQHDPYKLMASELYGVPLSQVTGDQRQVGKVVLLGCGYGLGWKKFMVYAKQQNIEVDEDFAKRTISVYRERFPYIPAIWKAGDEALDCIVSGYVTTLGVGLKLDIDGAIVLPNKFRIPYPNLRYTEKDNGKLTLVYDTKKGRAVVPKGIWGGAATENWSQALARLTIGEQMLMIARRYKVVMTVHDSVVVVAPQGEANEARTFVEQCMRIRPKWAAALPLNCESKMGASYGG